MKLAKSFVVAVLTLALVASASVVLAAGRVALVVGNSTYAHVERLPNAENDATDIAEALQRLGFKVTIKLDADRKTLNAALRAFASRSAGADVALVFYAGHGIEMNGANYLVPVDASLNLDTEMRFETVTLDDVLASTLGARLRLVILDACRNNRLASSMQRTDGSRSVSGGSFGALDPFLLGDETLVAYAAAAGTTAADGQGRNSPYTAALLSFLEEPLEIMTLFRRVRARVLASTNGQQRPHEYQSLVDEHYLNRVPAVPTGPQVPSAEQRAFADVESAVARFDSASGRDEMVRTAEQILDAAEIASIAFTAADRARDAALDRYYAAQRDIMTNLFACRNDYLCDEYGAILYFDDWATVEARDFNRGAAVSEANAAYIAAVDISGGAEALERAARLRRIGNRTRDLSGRDGWNQRDTLVIEPWNEESIARNALHSRAAAAHVAKNRAAIDAFSRAARTLSTAAGLLTGGSQAGTSAGLAAAEAVDQAVSAASDPEVSTVAALEELLFASRETMVSVRGEPDDDFSRWVRQVNAAVAQVEQAANEAEQAAAGTGSWFSRSSACQNARDRLTQASLQSLTVGTRRPQFITTEAGGEVWRDLGERIDEAQERSRAACESIEPPRR